MAASEATAARISGGAANIFPRRRLLHRAVAEAIETLYADRLDAPVAALAGHFWEAEVGPRPCTTCGAPRRRPRRVRDAIVDLE